MVHPEDANLTMVCNGEIYNYKELVAKHGFKMNSSSDCEVILHMYKKFGIEETVKSLDGVFAFVLSNTATGEVVAARDPIGVRSLFMGSTVDGSTIIASELK